MDNNTEKFLNIIKQIESSGGKNVNHPTMQQGIHAGDTAYGSYGLMPNTVIDVTNRLQSLNKLSDKTSPIVGLPKEQINDYLRQNPQAEEEVADFLARNLLARMKGNEEFAAKAWNAGSNLQPEQMDQQKLINDPYVSKYREIARRQALQRLAQHVQ